MALKRLLAACKLDRDLLGFNSSDRFSGRISAEYVEVCSTAGMSQLETACHNLHQRQFRGGQRTFALGDSVQIRRTIPERLLSPMADIQPSGKAQTSTAASDHKQTS